MSLVTRALNCRSFRQISFIVCLGLLFGSIPRLALGEDIVPIVGGGEFLRFAPNIVSLAPVNDSTMSKVDQLIPKPLRSDVLYLAMHGASVEGGGQWGNWQGRQHQINLGNRPITVTEGIKILQNNGVDFAQFRSVVLLSCRAAQPADPKFPTLAQQVADATQLDVIASQGDVAGHQQHTVRFQVGKGAESTTDSYLWVVDRPDGAPTWELIRSANPKVNISIDEFREIRKPFLANHQKALRKGIRPSSHYYNCEEGFASFVRKDA